MDYHFECPHTAPVSGAPQFVGDPDLIFLREDIADEFGAIVGYLECANLIKDYRISELFQVIANDENGHFIRLMRMVAVLDPVQAEELKKQGLIMLSSLNEPTFPYGSPGKFPGYEQPTNERHRREYAEKRLYTSDERVFECLKNAIRDELYAINAYQKQIQSTANPVIQNLLITIMNDEKRHLSEFTGLFYDIYRE